LIGIKSTARLFGAKTWPWLLGFALTSGGLMLGALALQAQGPAFWVAGLGVAAFVLHMMWQLRQFRLGETGLLLRLFRANSHTGFLPVVFFGLAIFLY
jgi:4-hydroxybenzoate polyprenyltransferase